MSRREGRGARARNAAVCGRGRRPARGLAFRALSSGQRLADSGCGSTKCGSSSSSSTARKMAGDPYELGVPSPESVVFPVARAARTRPRAPRWMPARAPIRGGRRCSPAWGDCAEPMASLAASARLHHRPAPRRPGGAPERGSPPAALVFREGCFCPRPEGDGGIEMAASGGKGEGSPRRRPAPERGGWTGACERGGAARRPQGTQGARRGAGPRRGWKPSRGRARGSRHPRPRSWKVRSREGG